MRLRSVERRRGCGVTDRRERLADRCLVGLSGVAERLLRFGEGDRLRFGVTDRLRFGVADRLRFGVGDRFLCGVGERLRFGVADRLRFGVTDRFFFGVGDRFRFETGDLLRGCDRSRDESIGLRWSRDSERRLRSLRDTDRERLRPAAAFPLRLRVSFCDGVTERRVSRPCGSRCEAIRILRLFDAERSRSRCCDRFGLGVAERLRRVGRFGLAVGERLCRKRCCAGLGDRLAAGLWLRERERWWRELLLGAAAAADGTGGDGSRLLLASFERS